MPRSTSVPLSWTVVVCCRTREDELRHSDVDVPSCASSLLVGRPRQGSEVDPWATIPAENVRSVCLRSCRAIVTIPIFATERDRPDTIRNPNAAVGQPGEHTGPKPATVLPQSSRCEAAKGDSVHRARPRAECLDRVSASATGTAVAIRGRRQVNRSHTGLDAAGHALDRGDRRVCRGWPSGTICSTWPCGSRGDRQLTER